MKLSSKDIREFLLNENTIERIYGTLIKLEVQNLVDDDEIPAVD